MGLEMKKYKSRKHEMKRSFVNTKVAAIVGPPSSGKSDLAITLAKKFNGEIISADSRQVYKGLDLSTGKVTKKEQREAVHHLLDVAKPGKQYSVAQFKKAADKAILDISRRGKLPILVGGSHLYVRAVLENYDIPPVKEDRAYRKKLEGKSNQQLLAILKRIDRQTFNRIDKKNKRRIIRALEVHHIAGEKFSSFGKKRNSPYKTLKIGIDVPREKLYKRIDERVIMRVKRGMIREIENVLESGVSTQWLKNLGLESRFITEYLLSKKKLRTKNYLPRGQASELRTKKEMIERLQFAIHDFARRQLVWYRKEKNIHWVQKQKKAEILMKEFIAQ